MNRTINVNMRNRTVGILAELTVKLNSPSKSDTIRRALELNLTLVNHILAGDDLFIHDRKGLVKKLVKIPGMYDD